MQQQLDLLASILAQLGLATPLLVYADWLEEQGDAPAAEWWRSLAQQVGATMILGPEPRWLDMLVGMGAVIVGPRDAFIPNAIYQLRGMASPSLNSHGPIYRAWRDGFGRLNVMIRVLHFPNDDLPDNYGGAGFYKVFLHMDLIQREWFRQYWEMRQLEMQQALPFVLPQTFENGSFMIGNSGPYRFRSLTLDPEYNLTQLAPDAPTSPANLEISNEE